MSEKTISRRSFLNKASVAAPAAFTIAKPYMVRAAGKEKLRVGLVGCGGRGTQAVSDMLAGNENVELVAMADVFEDHLERSLSQLREGRFPSSAMSGPRSCATASRTSSPRRRSSIASRMASRSIPSITSSARTPTASCSTASSTS